MAKVKLAIVGTVQETAILANKLDESWTVWTLNGTWGYVNRSDKHFELHDINYLSNLANINRQYFDYLKSRGKNLFIKSPDSRFPDAVGFPLQEILIKFPYRFLTSTPAMVLAYALSLYEGELEQIAIYGIDMASADEYRDQRECFYFYLGYASGKGIDIALPKECPLLQADHIYSYEQASPLLLHTQKSKLNAEREKKQAESQKFEALKKEQYFLGVTDAYEDLIKIFKR